MTKALADIDLFFENLIPKVADRWVNLLYTEDIKIIKDIVYPNTVKQLRPGNGRNGVKMPGGPQYIVIHDTGMTHEDDDADGLSRYIHAQANSETGRVASWHFSIDDKKVYQHIPTDEIGWHAGDGSRGFGEQKFNEKSQKYDIGGGNQNGIGIETCINPDNDYELTLKRTAKLTAKLLYKYRLGIERVKQHYDFSSKICPNVIINSRGLWEVFLKDVEAHLLLEPFNHKVEMKWENSHPQIIEASGRINTPIIDTIVNLKLSLVIDSFSKDYHYQVLVKGLSAKERIKQTYFDLYHRLKSLPNNKEINLPSENQHYQTKISWINKEPFLDGNNKKIECHISSDLVVKTFEFNF